MALFVTERDRKLLSKINRELIDNIIESKILYYQLSEEDSNTNIYGEANIKYFAQSFIIPCMIEREEQNYSLEDGKLDHDIQMSVYFLRDYLVDNSIKMEIGNYIKFNNEYYEIDAIIENRYMGDKNPDTSIIGDGYGWNVSIGCRCHLVDQSMIQLEEIRFN